MINILHFRLLKCYFLCALFHLAFTLFRARSNFSSSSSTFFFKKETFSSSKTVYLNWIFLKVDYYINIMFFISLLHDIFKGLCSRGSSLSPIAVFGGDLCVLSAMKTIKIIINNQSLIITLQKLIINPTDQYNINI